MTTVDPAMNPNEPTAAAPSVPRWLKSLDDLAVRLTDRINPILVKETRQALKSRQFTLIFTILLVVVWGWSALGLVMQPAIQYAIGGPMMLCGYASILEFVLIILVPIVAFRSLSGEREDGTYELMSITNLSPRQIIGGKLGSAVLQMLIYMSAVAPCIAFTYLLRGVDILSIVLFLVYIFSFSVLLSTFALLLATVSRERHWQTIILLGVLIVSLIAFCYTVGFTVMLVMLAPAMPFDSLDFWAGILATFMTAIGFFVLLFEAAAARVTFASDNRSTRLRIVMLIQHAMAIGWGCYFWISVSDYGALLVPVFCCVIYWCFMGVLMSGESKAMSDRVQRSLPQSFLGRIFFTLLNPGPGTGSLFAISSVASLVILMYVAQIASNFFGAVRPVDWEWPFLILLMFCYMVIYLGIGRIVMAGFTRLLGFTHPALALLVNILLLLIGVLGPLIVQFTLAQAGSFSRYYDSYTSLQISNPFWTLSNVVDGGVSMNVDFLGIPVIPMILIVSAACMLYLHLRMSQSEIRYTRVAVPARVTEEQLALHPAKEPPPPEKISPWDDD